MLACGGSFGVALFGQGRTGANETRTETSRSLLALPTATPIRLQSQSGQVVQLQSDVVDDPSLCLAVDRGVDILRKRYEIAIHPLAARMRIEIGVMREPRLAAKSSASGVARNAINPIHAREMSARNPQMRCKVTNL
ncbi:hypothetical protein E6R61_25155 [Streptomyces sp. LRa12]|nr:hypothetical protein E6R61_25155 [Streptomyces sp. LRa12]